MSRMQKVMVLLSFGIALIFFSGVSCFAEAPAIEIDAVAIEAEIAAAVAAGQDPAIAAKAAVAHAVENVMKANADYPGGMEALKVSVLKTLASLNITGLTTVETQVAGSRPIVEAEIAAAVAAGEEPTIAAKNAVANMVASVIAANQGSPAAMEAVKVSVAKALASETFTGLKTADVQAATNHALGTTVDLDLEAYAPPVIVTPIATAAPATPAATKSPIPSPPINVPPPPLEPPPVVDDTAPASPV